MVQFILWKAREFFLTWLACFRMYSWTHSILENFRGILQNRLVSNFLFMAVILAALFLLYTNAYPYFTMVIFISIQKTLHIQASHNQDCGLSVTRSLVRALPPLVRSKMGMKLGDENVLTDSGMIISLHEYLIYRLVVNCIICVTISSPQNSAASSTCKT